MRRIYIYYVEIHLTVIIARAASSPFVKERYLICGRLSLLECLNPAINVHVTQIGTMNTLYLCIEIDFTSIPIIMRY